jgi:hypothetical protein
MAFDLTRKITATRLTEAGGCWSEVSRFKRLFPRGTMMTEKAVKKAYRARLDLGWLLDKAGAKYSLLECPLYGPPDRVGRCKCRQILSDALLAAKARQAKRKAAK